MAFTYLGDLSTDRDKVRFYLQDTASGSGPKPGDENFTDAEIDGLVALEGSWQRAVAAGFETLAASWRRYPSFSADGLSLQRTNIADGFAAQAAAWRKKHGYGANAGVGHAAATRVDGYSDNVDNMKG